MNDKFKKLTKYLADTLAIQTGESLNRYFKNEDSQDTSDILNLVLSAHLSSLANCMKALSEPHPDINKRVDVFIDKLTSYVSTLNPITNIEKFDNELTKI